MGERKPPHIPCDNFAVHCTSTVVLLAGGTADSAVDPFLTNRCRQLRRPGDTIPQQEKEVPDELLHHAACSGRSLSGSNTKRLFLLRFHSTCFPFSC